MNETPSSGKIPLLFLCHRIPYPPNKGDKIRSFHLLHHLSGRFDIFLATFVDDPDDWSWIPEVDKFCRKSLYVRQRKSLSTLRSVRGLFTGQALSVPYYYDRDVEAWVEKVVDDYNIEHAMVYSSSMAQYALFSAGKLRRKVLDFVDIDSDKWSQYAEQKKEPLKWLYRREARKLFDYEVELVRQFDIGLFVSSVEAAMFRKLSPETADKVGYYNNGVNSEYFAPASCRSSPFPDSQIPIVFTGAMDYWPNIDAVNWFADKVLPMIRAELPELHFYIVGSNPAKSVRRLESRPGIVVTGRVEDMRPYLQHARAAVAPMRIARGVQNKVLEAMSMETPVIVSNKGLEGLKAEDGVHLMVAESVDEYCKKLRAVIDGEHAAMGSIARRYVHQDFNWNNNLPEVALLLERESTTLMDRVEQYG